MHLVPPKDPPIQCVIDLTHLITSGEAVEKKDWAYAHYLPIEAYVLGRLVFGVPPEVDAGMVLAAAEEAPSPAAALAACEELKSAIVACVPPEDAKQGALDAFWKYLYETMLPLVLKWLDHLKGEQSPA